MPLSYHAKRSFKDIPTWKTNAEHQGLKVRKGVRPDGDDGDYFTAHDMEGNFRGYFDPLLMMGVLSTGPLESAMNLTSKVNKLLGLPVNEGSGEQKLSQAKAGDYMMSSGKWRRVLSAKREGNDVTFSLEGGKEHTWSGNEGVRLMSASEYKAMMDQDKRKRATD